MVRPSQILKLWRCADFSLLVAVSWRRTAPGRPVIREMLGANPPSECTDFTASYGMSSESQTSKRTIRAQPFID
jgi:hypothetical protein